MTLICARLKRARLLGPGLLFISLLAGAVVACAGFWRGDVLALDLSSFAPLPFALTVDRLSAFFLLLICAVGAPIILYSACYIDRHYGGARRNWLWALLPLFIASMVLVVTASTAFAFLFGWELMTLFSAGLILIEGDSASRRHDICIYLLMMHAGAAAVIGAFLLFLPRSAGLQLSATDFASMRAAAAGMPSGLRTAIFLLSFAGFGAKAGIIPLHLWLPRAHPIAPTPVSALMSGIMLKTAVYGTARFVFDFLGVGGAGPSWWGYAVLAAGAISGLLGVIYAISENDLKRLLAYSSIENIGIIYLGFGAALVLRAHNAPDWAAVAMTAALLHSLSHALFKSLLFLGAGAVSDAAHTLNLEDMGGLLRRMPVAGTSILVACCSIAGLPLFNGFISEWLLFRTFLAGSALTELPPAVILPLMIGVLAMIGGLGAACFAKLYGVAFLGRPRTLEAEHAQEVPLAMRVGMAMLAAACVAIGVAPAFLLRPLGETVQPLMGGAAMPQEAASLARVMPTIALALCAVVSVVIAWKAIWGVARQTATWACGLPGLDSRMQYTATAFSKPLRIVFGRAYRPARTVEVLPPGEVYFPASVSYRSVRTTSFERWLYRPAVDAIVAAARRLRRLQTGNIQVYLLYIFLALVALLIYMKVAS